MKQLLAIVFAAILAAPVLAQDADAAEEAVEPVLDVRPATEVVLTDFLWLNRIAVVFADTDRDPAFKKQLDLLAERPLDLLTRDVIVVTDTNPTEPSDIRTELRPRGFGLVLIDKDGRVALRKPSPWSVRELSHAIDKMPSRIEELASP